MDEKLYKGGFMSDEAAGDVHIQSEDEKEGASDKSSSETREREVLKG
jgi:hypothetical protein